MRLLFHDRGAFDFFVVFVIMRAAFVLPSLPFSFFFFMSSVNHYDSTLGVSDSHNNGRKYSAVTLGDHLECPFSGPPLAIDDLTVQDGASSRTVTTETRAMIEEALS